MEGEKNMVNCVNCEVRNTGSNHRHLCERCNSFYEKAKRHGQIETMKIEITRLRKEISELEKGGQKHE